MQKKWMFLIITLIFTTIVTGTGFAVSSIKTNKISNQEQLDIEKRLNLLEFALISQSPKEVADTWAKGVMTRNGALQFAVLCDNLQSKYISDFHAWDWWTGTSSPWGDSYQISTEKQQKDGTWKFIIKFHYTDSTNTTYSSISNILVGPKKSDKFPLPIHGTEQQWCVIRIDTSQFLQKDAAK